MHLQQTYASRHKPIANVRDNNCFDNDNHHQLCSIAYTTVMRLSEFEYPEYRMQYSRVLFLRRNKCVENVGVSKKVFASI